MAVVHLEWEAGRREGVFIFLVQMHIPSLASLQLLADIKARISHMPHMPLTLMHACTLSLMNPLRSCWLTSRRAARSRCTS